MSYPLPNPSSLPSHYSTYKSGNYFFMDSESFEEKMVSAAQIEETKKWISEGMEVDLIYFISLNSKIPIVCNIKPN